MIDLTTVSSIAFRAIKANKMRSILTSLGIIIGVGAVIVNGRAVILAPLMVSVAAI